MNSRMKIRNEVDILKERIKQLESENTDLKCQLGQEEKGKQQECLVATEEKEAKLDDDRNTTRQKYDVENDYHFEFNGHAVQP